MEKFLPISLLKFAMVSNGPWPFFWRRGELLLVLVCQLCRGENNTEKLKFEGHSPNH
jgi:hypothetical protein